MLQASHSSPCLKPTTEKSAFVASPASTDTSDYAEKGNSSQEHSNDESQLSAKPQSKKGNHKNFLQKLKTEVIHSIKL